MCEMRVKPIAFPYYGNVLVGVTPGNSATDSPSTNNATTTSTTRTINRYRRTYQFFDAYASQQPLGLTSVAVGVSTGQAAQRAFLFNAFGCHFMEAFTLSVFLHPTGLGGKGYALYAGAILSNIVLSLAAPPLYACIVHIVSLIKKKPIALLCFIRPFRSARKCFEACVIDSLEAVGTVLATIALVVDSSALMQGAKVLVMVASAVCGFALLTKVYEKVQKLMKKMSRPLPPPPSTEVSFLDAQDAEMVAEMVAVPPLPPQRNIPPGPVKQTLVVVPQPPPQRKSPTHPNVDFDL